MLLIDMQSGARTRIAGIGLWESALEKFDFAEAVRRICDGRKVKREFWRGKDFLSLQGSEDGSVFMGAQTEVPILTLEHLKATDWMEVK